MTAGHVHTTATMAAPTMTSAAPAFGIRALHVLGTWSPRPGREVVRRGSPWGGGTGYTLPRPPGRDSALQAPYAVSVAGGASECLVSRFGTLPEALTACQGQSVGD